MQNYTNVIVPKMEEAFKNLGAKFAGDPDIGILYAGVSEINSLLQLLYREGTQLHADHAQAIQAKQELDESLLQSVAELSLQTEKVRGLSKHAIQDVNKFLKTCTTVIIDAEQEKAANAFMTLQVGLKMSAEALNTKILKQELEIEKEKHRVRSASTELPKMVMKVAVLQKMKRMRDKQATIEARRLSDKADRARKMEALKHEERLAKLQQTVESSTRFSLLDYEDDYEAPRVANFVDDEAVEAKRSKFNDYDYDSES